MNSLTLYYLKNNNQRFTSTRVCYDLKNSVSVFKNAYNLKRDFSYIFTISRGFRKCFWSWREENWIEMVENKRENLRNVLKVCLARISNNGEHLGNYQTTGPKRMDVCVSLVWCWKSCFTYEYHLQMQRDERVRCKSNNGVNWKKGAFQLILTEFGMETWRLVF